MQIYDFGFIDVQDKNTPSDAKDTPENKNNLMQENSCDNCKDLTPGQTERMQETVKQNYDESKNSNTNKTKIIIE